MKNSKGVSPFIASVLTILFGVIMLGIVLNVINPVFSRAQDSSVVSDAFQNMNLLNSVIKEVASEAEGSKRTISLSVSGGEYTTDINENLLMFTYDPSESMDLRGSKGEINLEQGLVFDDYFNHYVDGTMPVSVWTNISGEWDISSYKYSGDGGLAYHNLSTVQSVWFSGDIYNSSGTGGQIFVTPTNPERLVAFWGFDEGSGTKAYDLSGKLNNGTLTNEPTWTSGIVGTSVQFDGDNDYIDVQDTDIIDSLGMGDPFKPFSISAWFKMQDILGTDTYSGGIIKWGQESNGLRRSLLVWNEGSGTDYYLYFSGYGAGSNLNSGVVVDDGQWHHTVATCDSSKYCQIYVDGVLENSDTLTLNDFASTGIRIGKTDSSEDFIGVIDEVKIWNLVLSADEVFAEYYLSQHKLMESGSASAGVKVPNGAIVLTNPDGVTSFDNIKISDETKDQTFVIPYTNIDLNGTLRIPAGEYSITVEHMGINTTVSKPIIQVTSR